MITLAWATPGPAQEITGFALTDWSGVLESRSTIERVITTSDTGTTNRIQQINLERELSIRTRSYVYHPNLLVMDVSGGATLGSLYDRADGKTRNSVRGLANLDGRLSFLREKPYRADIYFQRSNPTVRSGLGDASLATNSRVGLHVALLDPFVPVTTNMDLSRRTSSATGSQRTSDDSTTRLDVRMNKSVGDWGNVAATLQSVRAEARAQSLGAAPQRTRTSDDSLNFTARARLGERRQHNLGATLDLGRFSLDSSSTALPTRSSTRLSTTLRSRLSDEWRSVVRYNTSLVAQGSLSSDDHRLSWNVDWDPGRTWRVGASTRGAYSDSTDRRLTLFDVGTNGSYRLDSDIGRFEFQGAGGFQHQDQRATNPVRRIVGESVTLNAFLETSLSVQNVVSASVTVQNTARTVTFVEGVDYALSVVGDTTRIRRLIGTTITDGQIVLVDYSADVGGTFASRRYRASARMTWRPTDWLSSTFSHARISSDLVSGRTSVALPESHTTRLELRADYPLGGRWDVRTGTRHDTEWRSDTQGRFTTHRTEAYVQGAVPGLDATTLRVTGRRTARTNEGASLGDDTDLLGLDVSLRGRPYPGVSVSAIGNVERDDGSRNARSRASARLRASWRYRQFTLSGDLSHVVEQQGTVTQTRTFGQLLLRRDF